MPPLAQPTAEPLRHDSHPRRIRLAPEPLEAREVPAADFWAVGTEPGVTAGARLFDGAGAERLAVVPFGDGFTGGLRPGRPRRRE